MRRRGTTRAAHPGSRILHALAAMLFAATAALHGQQTVEILVTEYPPFMGSGGRENLWCELAAAAFEREGIQAVFVAQPLERIKASVIAGQKPVFLNSTLVVSREEAADLLMASQPMIYAEIDLFYLADRLPGGFVYNMPADLSGRKVGALRGTGSVTRLAGTGAMTELSNDLESLFHKLDYGRVELVAAADLTGLETARRVMPASLPFLRYAPFYHSPIDLIFSKDHPESKRLMAAFGAGLAKIKADGSYLAIVGRYYPAGHLNASIFPPDVR